MKDPEAKKHVAQQISSALAKDAAPTFDIKTGQIKSKKVPKEKTAEENAMKELKTLQNKLHVIYGVCLFSHARLMNFYIC